MKSDAEKLRESIISVNKSVERFDKLSCYCLGFVACAIIVVIILLF